MRSSKRKAFILATATSFAGIYGLTAGQASGANATWNTAPASSFWNSSSNWSSAGAAYVPVTNDSLFFGANSNGITSLIDDIAAFQINGLTFSAGAANYTIGGTNTLTLNPSANIINTAGAVEVFNLPIALSSGNHVIANSATTGTLSFNGGFTRNTGTTVEFFRGSTGSINFAPATGPQNDATGIIGGWALFGTASLTTAVNGGRIAPTDWATRDGSGNIVAYTGYAPTINSGGTIASDGTKNLKITSTAATNVTVTYAAGQNVTDVNTILYTGGSNNGATLDLGTAGKTLRMGANGGFLNASATAASGNGTLLTIGLSGVTAALTAGGAPNTPGELNILSDPVDANTASRISVNAPIVDNGTNGTVTVNTTGYVAFNGTNTYTGGTYINGGRIQAGTGAFGTGPVYIFAGAQTLLNQNFTYPNNFFVRGFGSTESGGIGAIRFNSTSHIISGTITLEGDTALSGNGQVTGRIIDDTPSKLFIGSGSASGSGTLIIGSAAGPNDYHGDTQINNDGSIGGVAPSGANVLTFIAGRNNVMPHGAGYGNLIMNGISATVGAGFDLNGTTQTINGLINTATSPTNNIILNRSATAGTLNVGDNNVSSTFNGLITNNGTIGTGGGAGGGSSTGLLNLTKIGNGVLTLGSTNTYTGVTTVSGGTLALAAAGSIGNSSSIVVGSSGTFDVAASTGGFKLNNNQSLVNNGYVTGGVTVQGGGQVLTNNGTMTGAVNATAGAVNGGGTFGNLTIGGGASINLNNAHTTLHASTLTNSGTMAFTISGATSDSIAVSGPATLTSSNIVLTLVSAATQSSYDVVTAGSITGTPNLVTTQIGRTNFSLAGSPPPGVVRINVTGGPASLIWNNTGGSPADGMNWDTTQQNFQNGGTPDKFFTFDNVTFDDNNNGNYTVNISSNVNPNTVTFNNNTGTYTLNGSQITGASALTKNGTGALNLNNQNSMTGGVILNSGTLNINNGGALGAGTFVVNGGTVDVPSAGQNLTNNVPIVLNNDLVFRGSNELNTGAGPVTLTATRGINVNASTLTIGGPIAGVSFGINKTGAGTLVLSGTSTFSGASTLSAGVVHTTNGGALGSADGTVTIQGGTFTYDPNSNSITVGTPGADLDTDLGPTTLSFGAKTFHISGGGVDGNGVLRNTGSNQQLNAYQQVVLDADAVVNTQARFDIRGGTPVLDLQGHTLIKRGSGDGSGTGNAGQMALVSVNVTAGNIIVSEGRFGVESATTLQDGATPGSNGTVTLMGSTIFSLFNNANGDTLITRPIVVQGSGVKIGNGSATPSLMGSNIRLQNDIQFTNVANSAGALTLTGNISQDASPRKVIKNSGGTNVTLLTLSGNNTFTGGVDIQSGTLILGSAGALNAAGSNTINFNTSTGLRLNGNSPTVAGISGGGGSPAGVLENANANPATITINTNGQDFNYDGTINDGTGGGALSVVKNGPNRQTLNGSGTYSGATIVNNGTLEIGNGNTSGSIAPASAISGTFNGTISFNRSDNQTISNGISGSVNVFKNGSNAVTYSGTSTSTGTTTVNSGLLAVTGSMANSNMVINGGSLTGTGTIGATTLNGGTLQAGATGADGSLGTLTLASFNSQGGNMRLDISPTASDRIAVTGGASFSNTTTIVPFFTSPPVSTGSITLLTASSVTLNSGANIVAQLPTGQSRLHYTAQSNANSVYLVVDSALGNLLWTGNNTNAWDVNVTPNNWKNLATNAADNYFEFDVVNFDSTSAVRNISLGVQIAPTQVNVNDATTYTVSGGGGFTGTLGFNKGGIGTFVVSTTNNNFSGPLHIMNGMLSFATTSTPNAMDVTLGDGSTNTSGVLDAAGNNLSIHTLGVAGTGTGNAVTNTAATTGTVTYSGDSNPITWSVPLTDGGAGTGTLALAVPNNTLILSANNTYSGTTTIGNATLQVGNGGATGSLGTGPVTNGGTIILNRTGNFTVGNAISGNGTLLMSSPGTVTLTGSSSYTNQTVINSGTLSISASNNLGDDTNSSNQVTLNGGALQNTGANVVMGSSRNINVAAAGTIDAATGSSMTVNGQLQGSAAWNKTGPGKVVFSNTGNTYTGAVNVRGGVIEQNGTSTNFLQKAGQVHFFDGTIHITGNNGDIVYATQDPTNASAAATSNKFTTSGTTGSVGTFDIDAGVTLQVGGLNGGVPNSTTAALQTAGSGSAGSNFTKTGAGTLRLVSQNNQLDVALIVMQGTIDAWSVRGMGGIDNAANFDDMRDGTTVILDNDGSSSNVTGSPNNTNVSGSDFLTGLRAGTAGGSFNLTVNRINAGAGITHAIGALQSAGDFTMNVTTGSNMNSGAGGLMLYPSVSANGAAGTIAVPAVVLSGNGTFNVVNGSVPMTMTINGGITGSFGVTKTGNGTLILQDTNFGTNSIANTPSTFSGDTKVMGGLLQLLAGSALQQSALDYNNYGGNLSFATLSAATFGGLKGAQNLAMTNDVAGNVALSVGKNGVDNTYTGILSGGGSLTKIGTGTQTLSGNNTYTGGTNLAAGELGIATDSNIAGAASTVNFNGGLLRVTGTAINNLNTHTVNWSTFNGGFDIADSTNTFSVSNNIAGSGSMTKTGAGTLLLSGANSYTGGTSLRAGKLVALGDAARGPLLSGTGTTGGTDITGGQLILDYSPGGSTNPASTVLSTLTAGYNLPTKFSSGTLRSSATPDNTKGLGWRDDAGNKQVTVMYTYYGDASVDGQVTTVDFNQVAANFNATGNWAAGDFNYDGIVNALDFNAVATNFGKVALPSQPALGAPVLGTLVPEPGTALLGVAAGLGLMRRRRRAR